MSKKISSPKVLNAFSPKEYRDDVGEVNVLPSETIPDQTLSIREIFNRFARGEALEGRPSVYSDDDDLPEFDKMSKIEIAEFAEANRIRLEQLREHLRASEEASVAERGAEVRSASRSDKIEIAADNAALGIEAEILSGEARTGKIAADSPTRRGTPKQKNDD